MRHKIHMELGEVRLRPARAQDGAALQPLLDERMWAGMATPFPASPQEFARAYGEKIADPATVVFSVEYRGELVGRTCFYDMHVPLRLELGSTFYLPAAQGTTVNPSCKYLLLEYAFTVYEVQRVGLRCDVRNERSARAIAALGATEEGVARAFRRGPHSEPVDTRVFSTGRACAARSVNAWGCRRMAEPGCQEPGRSRWMRWPASNMAFTATPAKARSSRYGSVTTKPVMVSTP